MEVSIRVTTKATVQALVEALEDAGLIYKPDGAGAPTSIYLGPSFGLEHGLEITYAVEAGEKP